MPYFVHFDHSGQPKLPLGPPPRLSGLGRRRRAYRMRGLGQNEAPGVPLLDANGQPVSSTPPPANNYGPAPSAVFDFGYNPPPSVAAGILGPSLTAELLPESESGESGTGLTIPGSTGAEILANAASGTLTTAQSAAIQQNEQAELIQAGMDPATAAAQSQSDVNAALTEAGAAPSQAWWDNPIVWIGAAVGVGILIFVVKR